jgi:hypothetical protein
MSARATQTQAQYLTKLDPKARAMMERIRKILKTRKALVEFVGGTTGSPYLGYSIDGHYVYGLASRKDGIRLYSMSIMTHPQLKKKYNASLGKFLVGKSCMRFRKLEDIDQGILKSYVLDVAKIQALKL